MFRFASPVLAGLLLASASVATSAHATTFVGAYSAYVNDQPDDPDGPLQLATADLTPGAGAGFSFDLTTVGQTAVVNLFDIWTPEEIADFENSIAQPIAVFFAFTAPYPIDNAVVAGVTFATTINPPFGYIDQYSIGQVLWAGGGNRTIAFGNGGELAVHLDSAIFNQGDGGSLVGQYAQRATITAQFTLNSLSAATVPEPATWALLMGGFGLTGAALRRRRLAPLAARA